MVLLLVVSSFYKSTLGECALTLLAAGSCLGSQPSVTSGLWYFVSNADTPETFLWHGRGALSAMSASAWVLR